jgi:hypothetical protein
VLVLNWRIDLQCWEDDLAGVVEGLTCTAVSLIRTPLLDGVC